MRTGYAMVAFSALLFAANGPISIVLIDGGLSARYVVTGRLLGMVLVLLTWAVLKYRDHLRFSGRELLELAFFGIAGLALMQWTYAEAIARVDIGLVLMIEYMAPFLIALYSWVLWRHRQQRAVWVSAFVAIAGLTMVLDVGGDSFARLSGPGLVFSVTTCLIFSYYATHASKLLRERPPQVVLGLGGLFAVIFWSLTLAPIWNYPMSVVGGQVPLGGNLGGSLSGFVARRPRRGRRNGDPVRAVPDRRRPDRTDAQRDRADAGVGDGDRHLVGVAAPVADPAAARRRPRRRRCGAVAAGGAPEAARRADLVAIVARE